MAISASNTVVNLVTDSLGGSGGGGPAPSRASADAPSRAISVSKFSLHPASLHLLHRVATRWITTATKALLAITRAHPMHERLCDSVSVAGDALQAQELPDFSYVCKEGKKIQGFVSGNISGETLKVGLLLTDPSRILSGESKGVGTFLLQKIEQAAKAEGAILSKLHATLTSEPFYTIQGYDLTPLTGAFRSTYTKSLADTQPLEGPEMDTLDAPYAPHVAHFILESEITDEMFNLLQDRTGMDEQVQYIRHSLRAKAKTFQLVGQFDDVVELSSSEESDESSSESEDTGFFQPLEALFLVDTTNPVQLKVIMSVDGSVDGSARSKALDYLRGYAQFCGRELDATLIETTVPKRGVGERGSKEQIRAKRVR